MVGNPLAWGLREGDSFWAPLPFLGETRGDCGREGEKEGGRERKRREKGGEREREREIEHMLLHD